MASNFLRRFAVAVAVIGVGACPTLADEKPDISSLRSAPITVAAQPVATFSRSGQERPLGKLKFMGGLVLTSPSPFFGGWSGLLLADDGQSLLALSDTAVWMTGNLTYSGTSPSGIINVRLGPLLEKSGRPIHRRHDRDSESIALEGGTFRNGTALIGFEGRHRIERFRLGPKDIQATGTALKIPAAAKHMDQNKGFEALTILKGGPYKGRPIAFSERLYDPARNHSGWVWTKAGPQTFHLKNIGDFDITDVASLDDGTIFVLERRFRWLEGVKMRVVRIPPDALAPGRTIDGETLIEADMADNIDNMEGLAATRLKSGGVVLTMISDDNFNHLIQRTVLLQFLLKETEQAKARLPN